MATQQEIELSKAFGGTGTLTPTQQSAVDTARSAFAPPNINDTKGSTFVPDFSLNPPTTPNTSGVVADANALTNNQLLTSEEYRKLAPQQKTQQKDSLIGNILSKTENKNTVGYMQELQQMQSDFLASKGYTQETFNQLNNFASQAQSLSNDLQRLNLEEKERIYQATGGFQLSGIKGAAENQIRREMAIQKAEVAYNLSVVTGQANLLQGQIDKANSLFEQALNYATAKEAQDVADWKFALEFYTDLDKEDRDYVQQQFENSLAIEANKRANAQLELDRIRESRLGGKTTGIKEDTFTDTVNYLKQLRDSGKLSDFSYKEQINALMQVGGYTEDQRGQVESMVNRAMEGRQDIGTILQSQPSSTVNAQFTESNYKPVGVKYATDMVVTPDGRIIKKSQIQSDIQKNIPQLTTTGANTSTGSFWSSLFGGGNLESMGITPMGK
jgi:hypothetical protein